MDFYLLGPGKPHWPEIQRLAAQPFSSENEDKVLRYVMEAIRLHGTFGGYREVAAPATIDDTGFSGYKDVKTGDKVFVSFVKASRDPTAFPDPDTVRLDREMDNYIHYGVGPHQCLGMQASRVALTSMLRTVARLQDLRPAPGPQGQLKKVDKGDGFYAYMTEDWGKFWPFPTTWKLHFDGEVPAE
jgi:linoleate 10R-lipoxygenase